MLEEVSYKAMIAESSTLSKSCDINVWQTCAATVRKLETQLTGKYFDLLFKGQKCKSMGMCGSELIGWLRTQEKSLPEHLREELKDGCKLSEIIEKTNSCLDPIRKLNYGGGSKKKYKICDGEKIDSADSDGIRSAMTIKNKSGAIVGNLRFQDGGLAIESTDAKGKVNPNQPMLIVGLSGSAISIKGYKRTGGDLSADFETGVSPECDRSRTSRGAVPQSSFDINGMRASSYEANGCGSTGGLILQPLTSGDSSTPDKRANPADPKVK